MFESISSGKVPQNIVNQIRKAILEGKVAPGERLRSEKELMDDFGVSKATLREALRALEFLGLVEIRKGANGGVFAKEVDIEITRESLVNFLHFKNMSIGHLSEIRKVLEPYAAKVAASIISEEDLAVLKKINEKCLAAIGHEKTDNLGKDIIRFHRVIAKCTGNPILIFILAFVEDLLEDTKKLLRPDDKFFQSVIDSHTCIYDALANRDAERAFEEVYKDVSKVEKSLVKIQNDQSLSLSGNSHRGKKQASMILEHHGDIA